MKKKINMFKTKEQARTPEIDLNERERCDLPNQQFKIMIINMLINVRRRMYEQSKIFNKEKIQESTKQKSQN